MSNYGKKFAKEIKIVENFVHIGTKLQNKQVLALTFSKN